MFWMVLVVCLVYAQPHGIITMEAFTELFPVRPSSAPPPILTFSAEERRALPMAMLVYVSPDSPPDAQETYKALLWLMKCYAASHDVAFIVDTVPVPMPPFMVAHEHDPLTWRYRYGLSVFVYPISAHHAAFFPPT